ncbi:lipase maturation factor family protein [Streptomyces sp. N2-109]|uniref:Lipase maturation factor family protein n=1 Tax=Streptomyces gossypii TaxID=2883101 RepID=A0ABT2JUD6_9ACTN|nr:lipase maturation factor family protein [Streptomyces gossypii]MCT2591488.1 lipase maturation factor family protein [Streptomyces gossypii]
MEWFEASDAWLSRVLVQRALAGVYIIAFVTAALQFRPLAGASGLLPVPRLLRHITFQAAPSVFHWHYSDRFFGVVAWSGAGLAVALAAGAADLLPLWGAMLMWAVLWALYLSIVNVGQLWYAFGWESLLLEAGFLAIFLGNERTAPPVLMLWLLRWLLFRVEFGAGLIKWRGDPCWRDLTCLYYHHETQPMPGPLSWYFHRLPKPLHRIEAAANHLTQLLVPIALFLPQPVAGIAAAVMIVTQLWLVLSGNFAWLNWLTIALALSALDTGAVTEPRTYDAVPLWYVVLVCAVTGLVAVLSYRPVRNLLSSGQQMNRSFDALHLVNTYGAFGSVTRLRHEVVIEGTDATTPGEEAVWQEYEFPGKPGDVRRRPPQFAPCHLRLDWQLWFAALSPARAVGWLTPLVDKLLVNDAPTLRLLRHNPFPRTPPVHVRVLLYRYRFTTRGERRETGAWWHRTLIGELLPPVAGPSPADRI